MNRFGRFLPDIPGIFCFISFFFLVLFGGGRALLDGDTLWHIKAGTIMLREGRILTTDVFSHTAFGKPWIAHEWLSEIIMGKIYSFAGVAGVAIFYFFLAVMTFWILFQIARQYVNEWFSFFCVALAFTLAYTHLLARPHIFTWFLGAVTLWILKNGGRQLYALPFIMLLWTNLHGGFVLGLVFQAIFLVGGILEAWPQMDAPKRRSLLRQFRVPLIVLGLSILVTGINPFGYKLLLFPFQATKEVFINGIGEWRSPNLRDMWYFRFYVLLILLLLMFRRKRTSWTATLLLLFFLNEAFTYVRDVSLAGLFLTPFLAETLQPWSDRYSEGFAEHHSGKKQLALSATSGPIATLVTCAVLLWIPMMNFSSWRTVSGEMFPLPDAYSKSAIQFIEKNRPKGKMFNEYSWGDYLIFALNPPRKVFIDGRADMYGEKIFGDYKAIAGLDAKTNELLEKYKVDWVVFPPDKPLTLYLKAEGNWKEVYRDDQVSILVRKAPEPS